MTGWSVFLGERNFTHPPPKKKKTGERRDESSAAAARSKCFLHNVKHVVMCILHASAREVRGKERRGEERRGKEERGGQQQQEEEEEELEGFDAMQTGSTKARRLNFSTHTTKTRAPAQCQLWRNGPQRGTGALNHTLGSI